MPLPFDATVGGANSTSYLTVAEAQEYFDERRLASLPEWDDADPSQEAALVQATQTIDLFFTARRRLEYDSCNCARYITNPAWTGSPATTTQRLAWPRNGMFDRNGNPIPNNIIPQELKDAVAELAGQLCKEDTTLDNDIRVKGITAVRAGSVSVNFKDFIAMKVLPDSVMNLLIGSWISDAIIEPALAALFDVL